MGFFEERGLAALAPQPGDLPGIPYQASPNHGSRGASKVDVLVWHYTAGPNASGAINWLRDPASKASAHFVIGRDGAITQLVPLDRAAWHAGDAKMNQRSIGVELANVGIVEPSQTTKGVWLYQEGPGWAIWKSKDAEPVKATLKWATGQFRTAWWVPYTPAQEQAMKLLVSKLESTKYAPATFDQRGHEDVAEPVGRKTDPGPLFPWALFLGRYPQHKTTVIESKVV